MFGKRTNTDIEWNVMKKKTWKNCDPEFLFYHFNGRVIFVNAEADIWGDLMNPEQFSSFIIKIICRQNKVLPIDICEGYSQLIGKRMVGSSDQNQFNGTKVKAGATISCVGTYEPHKHEMDPAILPRASKIICDSKEAALAETGDLLIPIAEGMTTEEDVLGSLGDVINGTIEGRQNDDEIIVYETVGVAAQDLVAAKIIYDKAVEAGKGLSWG